VIRAKGRHSARLFKSYTGSIFQSGFFGNWIDFALVREHSSHPFELPWAAIALDLLMKKRQACRKRLLSASD